ncbi:MAG: HAD family hydrolase [Bacteroidia bacterium]
MIKNIIFDLGGVILNLDQERTIRAFKKLGADLDELNAQSSIFKDFETGKTDEEYFIHYLKTTLKGTVETDQILRAWNAMLLDMPKQRVELIQSLKGKYKLFLFSNTNTLHMKEILGFTDKILGKGVFTGLFDKMYLSYEMGLRKPNPDSFHALMKDAGLKGFETVFIDDSKINLKGATEAGLHTIWAREPFDTWALKEIQAIKNLQMN